MLRVAYQAETVGHGAFSHDHNGTEYYFCQPDSEAEMQKQPSGMIRSLSLPACNLKPVHDARHGSVRPPSESTVSPRHWQPAARGLSLCRAAALAAAAASDSKGCAGSM